MFKKEHNKIKNSQRTGSSPDDVHVPKLWYYDQLLFLEDQDIPRKSHSIESVLDNFPFEHDDNEVCEVASNESDTQSTTSSTTSRTFKRPKNSKADQVLEKISNRLDQPFKAPQQPEKNKEAHDAFGENVAEQLRSLPPSMVPICKKLISDALYYAAVGQLNYASRITHGHAQNDIDLNNASRITHGDAQNDVLNNASRITHGDARNDIVLNAYLNAVNNDPQYQQL